MNNICALLLAALMLAVSLPVSATAPGPTPTPQLDTALSQARERQAPLLVDFHAPWCYSCYYMKQNVLNGAEWRRVEREAVVLQLDADSPEGAQLRERWNVKALPSYVVLNPQGEELGRIAAEQTRADFYRLLSGITARQRTLTTLQQQALQGDAAAADEVLQAFHARRDPAAGLAWWATLPETQRQAAALQKPLQRLRLQQAEQKQDAVACLVEGERALTTSYAGDDAYELDTVLGCTAALPAAQRRPLLAAQRPRLQALIESGGFGQLRCADQRSLVLVGADLDEALGDDAGARKLLDRAITDTQRRLGGNYRKDRNLADNLRVYLDRAGRTGELDKLMPKLIAAWPDDYVYPYRHGKSLLARGQAAAALPLLEQAAAKAYGINRFKVAEQRVLALQALKRDAEARPVVAETLKANGPWFPEEARKLMALVRP